MITGFNLLPWRENRRKRDRRIAVSFAVLFLVITAFLFAGWTKILSDDINYQKSRNYLLTQEIKKVEAKLKKVNEIEKRRESLLARMNVIQQLQLERILLIKSMNELAKITPDGIFFSSLKRTGDGMSFVGVAESSSRISTLMESLAANPSFGQPELSVINVGETQDFELWVSSNRAQSKDIVSGESN